MHQRVQWIAVAAIAALGLTGVGRSETRAATEKVDVAASTVKQARIDALTADAVKSLKRSADFLAAQKSFSFETDVSFDVLQSTGQMLEFGGTRDILIRRPDRLRAESARSTAASPNRASSAGSTWATA